MFSLYAFCYIKNGWVSLLHERHFCTRGHFCTASLLHGGSFLHEVTFLHGVTVARRVTFARGDIFIRRNLCMASLLARCCNSIATFLQNVIYARSYIFTEILCTAKFINNQNGASLLHAFLNNLIK